MNYTIVWNENKTEGIILSGEEAQDDAKYAISDSYELAYASLAGCFRDIYGDYQKCTIDSLSEPTQEMIEAGLSVAPVNLDSAFVERIYKAMIQKLTCNL